MGQIDNVVIVTRKIESLLDQLGASGKGLHQKITSVEDKLGIDMVKKLRWIATMRNKIVHEDGFYIDNIYDFVNTSNYVIYVLNMRIRYYSDQYSYSYSQKKGSFLGNIFNYIFSKR